MHDVWLGPDLASDAEYRLCGDVAGRRVLEVGIAPVPSGHPSNAIVFAAAGAKVIVVDPSAERIAALRHEATEAEVHLECHEGELAGFGFVTSASVDLVIAAHTVDDIDDLPRLLRQVDRVLRPGAPFVLALAHPVAAMFDGRHAAPARAYGDTARPFAELYLALERANFHVDALYEAAPVTASAPMYPTVLLVRARKQGS